MEGNPVGHLSRSSRDLKSDMFMTQPGFEELVPHLGTMAMKRKAQDGCLDALAVCLAAGNQWGTTPEEDRCHEFR